MVIEWCFLYTKEEEVKDNVALTVENSRFLTEHAEIVAQDFMKNKEKNHEA